MTARQKLELRRSEIRVRLGEISELQGEQRTAEIDGEQRTLMDELKQSETRLQAAIASEETEARHRGDQVTGDGTGPEVRSMLGRARLQNYVGAALQGRQVEGVEAELHDALELRSAEQGGVILPWELLDPGAPVEQRADTATALAATSGVGAMQSTIIQRVFAMTASAFLGVRMAAVGRGRHTYPIITGGTTAALVTQGTAKDATVATIGAATLEPKRLQARYVIAHEDVAKLEGYEEALRLDLNGTMSERLDHYLLNGDDATAPQWSGFFDALTDPPAPGAIADYAAFLSAYGSAVDGRHANTLQQIRLLVGPKTYQLAASLVQAGSGMTAVEYAANSTGGMQASALVPDPASDVQQAIVAKMGPGNADSAVCNVWSGGQELIYDPYSRSQHGEIALTAISLVDCAIIREAGFQQVAFQLA